MKIDAPGNLRRPECNLPDGAETFSDASIASGAGHATWVTVYFTDAALFREVRCATVGLAVISERERARYERLRRTEDKESYLAAHVAVRAALADVAATSPDRWCISYDPGGQPIVSSPSGVRAPRISISHTRGLAACAVSADAWVGIDVEADDRDIDVTRLARRNLSCAERLELETHGESDRVRRFLEYWTLKEAYAKALGKGLGIVPEISLHIATTGNVELKSESRAQSARSCSLRLLRAPRGYVASLAVVSPALEKLCVRQRVCTAAQLFDSLGAVRP